MKKLFVGFICITSLFAIEKPASMEPAPIWLNSARTKTTLNVSAFGDFLYWNAREGGLFYAQTGRGVGTSVSANGNDFSGKIARVKDKWDPGFRIGLMYNISSTKWTLFSQWTRFYTSAKDAVVSPSIVLTGHSNIKTEDLSKVPAADAKFTLHYNSIDLNMGYPFWISKRISLSPFFGAKGAFFKQKISIFYDYEALPVDWGRVVMHSNFKGGGLSTGCKTSFNFINDFGLYLVNSFALLYGCFKTPLFNHEDHDLLIHSRDKFYMNVPTLMIETGLQWNHSFKDKFSLALKCGWSGESWFRIAKFTHFMHRYDEGKMYKERGDLLMQGLLASLKFGF